MFRPKFQQKLTLAFIVLASALILFAEPTLAKKTGTSRKSDESSQAKQTASKPAPAPKAQQSSNASKSRSSAPSSSRSSQASSNSRSSSSVSRSTPTKTPSVRQPSRVIPSRSSSRVTSSRPITSRPSISTNNRRSTPSTINSRQTSSNINSSRSTRPSSNMSQPRTTNSPQRTNTRTGSITYTQRTRPSTATQQPAASSNNRISSRNSSRIGNPIGTQPPSTSTVRNQPTQSSTNRTNSRSSSTFGAQRTPPPTVAKQPAASSNNRISASKSRVIGNVMGKQTASSTRTTKQSATSPTNRNRSIIDSVTSTKRTPPSNVAKQPAESSNNRISSIDRANSRIGSVISPKGTPPPKVANQSAASRNNRNSSSKTRGIGTTISKQAQTTSRTRKQITTNPGDRGNSRSSEAISKRTPSGSITREVTGTREPTVNPRTMNQTNGRANRKATSNKQTTVINKTIVNTSDPITSSRVHRYDTARPSRLIYRDRPYSGRDYYHYDHTYVDSYSRIRRRLIWPRYRFMLCYNRGPWFSFRYFYPYYHRKYLFVSLGGYWPSRYRHARYYWYGCHPYSWYGYYPIAREVEGDTHNYYTYNYYYDDDNQNYGTSGVADAGYYDNLAEQPAEEPAQTTLADSYFDEAVKAFETGNYEIAIEKFAAAMALAPDDMVLPFAYCQALLAAEQYTQAAEVLRAALLKVDPKKEGVFYPRGLYPNEEILLAQLDNLAKKAEIFSFDADLQLLLGYQLLGIGQHDKAVTPLMKAGQDLKNADAAAVLLRLLEKIKTTESETQDTENKDVQIQDAGTIQVPMHSKIINKKHETKIKGTVLVATLCVLAGSTGIGHFFRV